MYAKLFTSIYQGTLRGNSHGLLVFTNLMAHADREGFADIHPKAIAEEVGLTVDEVKTAISMLESPDDESRSPEEQGRRIVRMAEHRAWGWKIVNYVKYRSIRDEDDRREQNRQSQANWRAKQAENKQSKPASAEVSDCSGESAHAEADVEADTDKAKACATKRSAPVPFAKILELYSEILPELPAVEKLSPTRQSNIRQRWREDLPDLEHWRNFFTFVRGSKFLMGRAEPTNGRPRFIADIDFLTKSGNFIKISEEKYHRE